MPLRLIEDSWIEEYMRYSQGQESPDLFHMTVALSVLGACLERNVYLDRVRYVIYPNLYTMLVAGSSKCHKGIAIKMGVDKILAKIDDPPLRFAEKVTAARLIQTLAEPHGSFRTGSNHEQAEEDSEEDSDENPIRISDKACAFAIAPEAQVFLGKQDLGGELIAVLTDLYDCLDSWEYGTKTAGRFVLRNVCLNLLAASTPKWLRSSLPEEVTGGGFFARMLFVYQASPRGPEAFPEESAPDNLDELTANLIHDLNIIRSLEGPFQWTPEGRDWFGRWYEQNFYAQDDLAQDDIDFYARWPQQLLKLAMCFSVAESDSLLLEEHHLTQARMFLDLIKRNMSFVERTITTTDLARPMERILGYIKRRASLSRRQLLRYGTNLTSPEGVKAIVQSLEEMGEIACIGTGKEVEYVYTGEKEATVEDAEDESASSLSGGSD